MLELLELIFGILELIADNVSFGKEKTDIYTHYGDCRHHYADMDRNHPAMFR